MKNRALLFLGVLAIAVAGCASHQPDSSVSLSELPSIYEGQYKVTPYLRAAVALQSFDRATALRQLHAMAQGAEPEARVIVLCRMLFVKRLGSDFMPPLLGIPFFCGSTDGSDWPLQPIELVDGVPFLITRGYALGGQAESDESYLRYCETNCNWSAFHFSIKSEQQKRDALNKLVALKLKEQLETYEQTFLEEQIQ